MRPSGLSDNPESLPNCGSCANSLHFGDPRFVACVCRLEYRPATNYRVCDDYLSCASEPCSTLRTLRVPFAR